MSFTHIGGTQSRIKLSGEGYNLVSLARYDNGKVIDLPVDATMLPRLKRWTLSHTWVDQGQGRKALPVMCKDSAGNYGCNVCRGGIIE